MKSQTRIDMEQLLHNNKIREYLCYCKDNYVEAVEAAKEMFPYYYSGGDILGKSDDIWGQYSSKAEEAKREQNIESEIDILRSVVEANIAYPYAYERLATLYGKHKRDKEAYEVCLRWFESDHWKIPNAATTSLQLLERLEKLEKRLKI